MRKRGRKKVDMVFPQCRLKAGHAPANFAQLAFSKYPGAQITPLFSPALPENSGLSLRHSFPQYIKREGNLRGFERCFEVLPKEKRNQRNLECILRHRRNDKRLSILRIFYKFHSLDEMNYIRLLLMLLVSNF